MEQKIEDTTAWQELERKNKVLNKELNYWKQKYTALAAESESKTNNNKYNPLLDNMQAWLNSKSKLDDVKNLVSERKILMGDTDKNGITLLMWAAQKGHYDMVQLCLNLGADIDCKDEYGKNAIDRATEGAWFHCEELLLFSKLNANVSDRVNDIAFSMNKQNGIIENIMNEMKNVIKDENKMDEFIQTLTTIMCNILRKKLSFSDDLFNLCWIYNVKNNNSNSNSNSGGCKDLWNTLINSCNDVINNGNKKDWYYFKTFILASNIWYRKTLVEKKEEERKDIENGSERDDYLFYKLLQRVDTKSKENLKSLDYNLKVLIDKNKNDWNKLIKWNLGPQTTIRQDSIVNGIKAAYDESDLIHHTSSSFNSRQFCDFNDYLPKLVLLAHMVDDEFQLSVQEIFNVNKTKGIGYLTNEKKENIQQITETLSVETFDDILSEIDNESKMDENSVTTCINNDNKGTSDGGNNSNRMQYTRGPVKLYSRALSKAENDYTNELYPTSACVLDFNRCTLTFYDIGTLLNALNLFVNKVKYYQSGNIIKIVRCKNTFSKYVNNPGYADIKLNVVIKGNTNNIIGEVQFLLNPMLKFKKQAHNLYSIQRQESFFKSSLSLILPQLLDKDKQLFVAGNMGNVEKLCQMMVLNNLNETDIMKIDSESQESILNNICGLDHVSAFKFVKSIVPNDLLMDRLFLKNRYDDNVIDSSLKSLQIFQQFFSNKIIVNTYKNDSSLIDNLLTNIAYRKTNYILKILISVIGEKSFIKHANMPGPENITMIEQAMFAQNDELVKILLSYKTLRQQYKTRKYWLFRLLYHLFGNIPSSMDTIDYVINELNLNESKELVLKTLFYYEYSEPITNTKHQNSTTNRWNYTLTSILTRIGLSGDCQTLKKLVSLIGDEAFVNNVLKRDASNATILGKAIRKEKIKMIKYILSFNKIKEEVKKNKYWLYRTIWWMFMTNKDTIDCVMNELSLSKDNIIDLITNYKYKEVDDDSKIKLNPNSWNYELVGILSGMGWYSNENALKTLINIVGENECGKFVFKCDAVNNTLFETALCAGKIKMIKLLVPLDNVKNVYQSDSYWIYRLFWLYENSRLKEFKSMFKNTLVDLGLTKEQSVKLLEKYQYKEKSENLNLSQNAVK